MNSMAWGMLAAVVGVTGVIVVSRYFSLWVYATFTGTRIGLLSLISMSLRKIDPSLVVHCKVMIVQAGLSDISTDAMEAQYLAGGNIQRVTMALIVAHRAGIELDWDTAAAVDLAGRNVLEAVQVSVYPKVIMCPDPASGHGKTLNGVARDGIQLKVRVLVTVRTNLKQLIGGATEATVIARVGQGIVTAIGSCENYRDALADPHRITRQVLSQGLDSQTAFAIVSIDVADIDVGDNIGARLQTDQAEADIRIARAFSEKRRAMAVALEQEMVALTRENEAVVESAEAYIPVAIAEAFRSGRLRIAQKPRRPAGFLEQKSRSIVRTVDNSRSSSAFLVSAAAIAAAADVDAST